MTKAEEHASLPWIDEEIGKDRERPCPKCNGRPLLKWMTTAKGRRSVSCRHCNGLGTYAEYFSLLCMKSATGVRENKLQRPLNGRKYTSENVREYTIDKVPYIPVSVRRGPPKTGGVRKDLQVCGWDPGLGADYTAVTYRCLGCGKTWVERYSNQGMQERVVTFSAPPCPRCHGEGMP